VNATVDLHSSDVSSTE